MASISRAGTSIPVRLTTLSAYGASMATTGLPIANVRVELSRAGISVSGLVVWLRGGLGGLHFEKALDPVLMMRSVPAPRLSCQLACRRDPLTPRPNSPVEEASLERCRNLLGIRPVA